MDPGNRDIIRFNQFGFGRKHQHIAYGKTVPPMHQNAPNQETPTVPGLGHHTFHLSEYLQPDVSQPQSLIVPSPLICILLGS